jgi:hypothetical protein
MVSAGMALLVYQILLIWLLLALALSVEAEVDA